MTKSKKGECIDAKNVPCPKAREYLKKHGRLCGYEKKDDAGAGAGEDSASSKPKRRRAKDEVRPGLATRIWDTLTT